MKHCRAKYLLLLCIVLTGGALLLPACGQKGDLYLPEKDNTGQRQEH
jgi:predicted small lipoprotein YifL